MTKRERLNAIATTHKHISVAYILGISDREKAHHNASVRPAQALRRWAKERQAGWDDAVLRQMRQEMHWVRQAIQRYAKNQEKFGERIKFFAQYWTALKNIREQMEVESKRFNTLTKPTPEQTNPRTYITKEEHHALKTNYATQYQIPGTRFAPTREPWLLSWQEPEEPAGRNLPKVEPQTNGGNTDE